MPVIDAFGGRLVIGYVAVKVAIADVLFQDGAVALGTDEPSLSGQGDILLSAGINEAAERHPLDARTAGKDHGQVIFHPSAEVQLGSLRQMQVDAAFQFDASHIPHTGRHDDRPSSPSAGLVDGLLDGNGCQPVLFQFLCGQRPRMVRKDGACELGHIKRGTDGCQGVGHTDCAHLVGSRDDSVGLCRQREADSCPQTGGNCHRPQCTHRRTERDCRFHVFDSFMQLSQVQLWLTIQ